MTFYQTIIEQLGGYGRLKAMINARNIGYSNEQQSVTFKFTGWSKANICIIRLTGADLYDMTFIRVRKNKTTPVAQFTELYDDQLIPVFQDTTGLRLSLNVW